MITPSSRYGSTAATAVQTALAPRVPDLVGEHPLMTQVRALVRKIAATNATVLVQGASGTGKRSSRG